MKYLVLECRELGDQWECDADRTPLCITDDISKYGVGYEIYSIEENGSLTLYKSYETSLESGMALYSWNDGEEEETLPTVIESYPNKTRKDFSQSFIRKLKQRAKFSASTNQILTDITCSGAHGEIIKDKWVVFGEYYDTSFSLGY